MWCSPRCGFGAACYFECCDSHSILLPPPSPMILSGHYHRLFFEQLLWPLHDCARKSWRELRKPRRRVLISTGRVVCRWDMETLLSDHPRQVESVGSTAPLSAETATIPACCHDGFRCCCCAAAIDSVLSWGVTAGVRAAPDVPAPDVACSGYCYVLQRATASTSTTSGLVERRHCRHLH